MPDETATLARGKSHAESEVNSLRLTSTGWLLFGLALVAVGCSGGTSSSRTVPRSSTTDEPTTQEPTTSVTTATIRRSPVASTAGSTLPKPVTSPPTAQARGLTTAATCRRFYEVTADFTLNDSESAAAYYALASETADLGLATAIREVADAFARNDPAISSADVQLLCG